MIIRLIKTISYQWILYQIRFYHASRLRTTAFFSSCLLGISVLLVCSSGSGKQISKIRWSGDPLSQSWTFLVLPWPCTRDCCPTEWSIISHWCSWRELTECQGVRPPDLSHISALKSSVNGSVPVHLAAVPEPWPCFTDEVVAPGHKPSLFSVSLKKL